MNSKNLLIQRRKSPYKMDKDSDRYRECPNDGVNFMASHRSTIFCSEKCADEYHNLKRKTLLEEAQQLEPVMTTADNSTPLTVNLSKVQLNLKILESLEIDKVNGSVFDIEWLYAQGYDFSAFICKNSLYNIPDNLECNFTQIGDFRLYRTEYSHILIKKNQ